MHLIKIQFLQRILLLLSPLLLSACAASSLHGFENAYQGYTVPESLVEQIKVELKRNGLPGAQIARDNVGRIRLTGSYRDEDEVNKAFVIVQSIIGIKSTSPFYPEDIKEKRWEADARRALSQFTKTSRGTAAKSEKRALIVGINTFRDDRLTPILGEDDARLVKQEAEKAGYKTTTLLGAQATKANIETALARLKREIGPDDSLLIYISSHGNKPIPSPRAKDARKMSIAAYDTGDTGTPGNGTAFQLKVHETSVSDTKVQELAQIPTRQTRVIIDTCYSGEILKGIADESSRYILKTNGGVPERSGISMQAWTGEAYASKAIFMNNESGPASSAQARGKDQRPAAGQQAIDPNRYTVITATSDGELSWGPSAGGSFQSPVSPDKKLQGSFFTQAFFEYLRQYKGHLEPAFAAAQTFTYDKVSTIPPPQNWKGPVPIQQLPRLNPPLPAGDASTLYD